MIGSLPAGNNHKIPLLRQPILYAAQHNETAALTEVNSKHLDGYEAPPGLRRFTHPTGKRIYSGVISTQKG